MTIAVLFAVGAGGWFFGVVSAYLLYRVMEHAVPAPKPEQWRRYDSQTFGPGDQLPGLNVRLTEDGGAEVFPMSPVDLNPPKLEVVK